MPSRIKNRRNTDKLFDQNKQPALIPNVNLSPSPGPRLSGDNARFQIIQISIMCQLVASIFFRSSHAFEFTHHQIPIILFFSTVAYVCLSSHASSFIQNSSCLWPNNMVNSWSLYLSICNESPSMRCKNQPFSVSWSTSCKMAELWWDVGFHWNLQILFSSYAQNLACSKAETNKKQSHQLLDTYRDRSEHDDHVTGRSNAFHWYSLQASNKRKCTQS